MVVLYRNSNGAIVCQIGIRIVKLWWVFEVRGGSDEGKVRRGQHIRITYSGTFNIGQELVEHSSSNVAVVSRIRVRIGKLWPV